MSGIMGLSTLKVVDMEKGDRSSSQRIYKFLERMITDGEVRVGEKLPTELELCKKYGVGRSTVREAARILDANGYVKIKRGSGTYVISKTGNNFRSIGNWLLDNREKLRDYMDVRLAIEQLAVKLFIKRLSEESSLKLRKVQEEFEAAIMEDDSDKISRLDEEFHRQIAYGSGNDLLIRMNELLADAFHEYRRSTFANKERHSTAIIGHQKILDAIARRDTNDAVYAMTQHLDKSVEDAIRQVEN